METEIKNEKAKAVMSLVNTMVDAYLSGFTPYPYLTLQQLHRVAQNHVKDNYGVEANGFSELSGEDLFNECIAISKAWDEAKTSDVDNLAKMTSELERIASCCAGSEAEFLIHNVLDQLKTDDPTLVVFRNLPKLPAGWKYSDAYRQPRDGEYYLFCGEIKHCKGRTAGWYHIVVRSEG